MIATTTLLYHKIILKITIIFYSGITKIIKIKRAMSGYRRTWNKEEYAQRARDRLEREERGDDADGDDDGGDGENNNSNNNGESSSSRGIKRPLSTASGREEFMPATLGADGPMGSERAFLRARSNIVDTESKVGKIEIVKPQSSVGSSDDGPTGPGFWCETCKCLLKDSSSYLDHINGKKHQRNLGFSMRVERVGLDAVKARIAALKQKKLDDKIRNSKPKVSAIEEYNSKISKLEEDEKAMRAQKKAEYAMKAEKLEDLKQQQKASRSGANSSSSGYSVDGHNDGDCDGDESAASIAAMMGFSGFGSTKK